MAKIELKSFGFYKKNKAKLEKSTVELEFHFGVFEKLFNKTLSDRFEILNPWIIKFVEGKNAFFRFMSDVYEDVICGVESLRGPNFETDVNVSRLFQSRFRNESRISSLKSKPVFGESFGSMKELQSIRAENMNSMVRDEYKNFESPEMKNDRNFLQVSPKISAVSNKIQTNSSRSEAHEFQQSENQNFLMFKKQPVFRESQMQPRIVSEKNSIVIQDSLVHPNTHKNFQNSFSTKIVIQENFVQPNNKETSGKMQSNVDPFQIEEVSDLRTNIKSDTSEKKAISKKVDQKDPWKTFQFQIPKPN